MSLRINNNVEAFNTHRQLVGSAAETAKSMERLSSGLPHHATFGSLQKVHPPSPHKP